MELPPKDPDHWLHRFSPEEWLKSAVNELVEGVAALDARNQRGSVAHARRAAGMALNAVLVLRPNETWGRSYMEHLRAFGADAATPEPERKAARSLLMAPLEGPRLVHIGGAADAGIPTAAKQIIEWCENEVSALLRA